MSRFCGHNHSPEELVVSEGHFLYVKQIGLLVDDKVLKDHRNNVHAPSISVVQLKQTQLPRNHSTICKSISE